MLNESARREVAEVHGAVDMNVVVKRILARMIRADFSAKGQPGPSKPGFLANFVALAAFLFVCCGYIAATLWLVVAIITSWRMLMAG